MPTHRLSRTLLALIICALLPSAVHAQELPERGDVRIVVISDLNGSYGSTDYSAAVDSTIARIPRLWAPDLVLAGGDMVAGQSSSLTDENVQAMWDAFDDHIGRPLREANLPFGFTIGNHDGSSLTGYQRDRDFASAYWNDEEHTPELDFVDRANFPFWYTFTHDDLFFLVWDASSATVQALNWVEEALGSEEAQNARMRFVIGHLPIYGVAEGRNAAGEVLRNPEALRSLLEEHDVHTYISGHHHAYYPARRGSLELLHAGSIASFRPLIGSTTPSPQTLTVFDIDKENQSIRYTTYEAMSLDVVETSSLPRSISSVNGFVLRRDLVAGDSYASNLSPLHLSSLVASPASGLVTAEIDEEQGQIRIEGSVEDLVGDPGAVEGASAALYAGVHGRSGSHVADLSLDGDADSGWTIEGAIDLDVDSSDRLLAGGYYVVIATDAYPAGELRGQILYDGNQAPLPTSITSPDEDDQIIVEDRLGQRLYKASWPATSDPDGDVVQYRYELAADADFEDVWMSESTGSITEVSASRRDLYALLADHGIDEGQTVKLYHRVVVTDGSAITAGESRTIEFSRGQPVASERPSDAVGFRLGAAFPNPASDAFSMHVTTGAGGTIAADVFNMLGQKVASVAPRYVAAGSREPLALDVAHLAPGVYVVRVTRMEGDRETGRDARTITIVR